MNITIGEYDAASRTVTATFASGDVIHERSVNACHDKTGAYDPVATAARLDEVGRGVAVKIGLGVIATPTEEPADVDG
ncbi:hypothetical protein U1763_10430 [Sphingomonas sp. LB2R24]|uniref:hypothetical protein n=1 Tax=Sphingomonas sorbitolis TaxID=3096165 RepID=UPI002FC58699